MDVTTSLTILANSTELGNSTSSAHPRSTNHVMFGAIYIVGIIGNAAAIVALRTGEKRVRNRKHLLLLTSLAANDLVALVGMVSAMAVTALVGAAGSRALCAARVALRVFGIGSVCIAVTMALERYLALTRPFLYQKVTYYVIRWCLAGGWLWAALLTCAPVLGLGLYYDEAGRRCVRYRSAVAGPDLAYAIFYVIFGVVLCVVLVYCNLAVIRALYAISAPRHGGQTVVRRVSKRSVSERARGNAPQHNAATAEEVAFSRLMATLSVLFMICWMPQMLTSALYLCLGEREWLRRLGVVSDALMLLNYVLDPLLYVLLRRAPAWPRALTACLKRSHKTSEDSLKTSCCAQETLVLSESGGAELRPLRAPAAVVVRVD